MMKHRLIRSGKTMNFNGTYHVIPEKMNPSDGNVFIDRKVSRNLTFIQLQVLSNVIMILLCIVHGKISLHYYRN